MAPKEGGFNLAAQRFAEIRGNWMTVVQAAFRNYEFPFGVEDYEIGVVARGQTAFAICAAGEVGGGFGHPAGDFIERKATLDGFGVHHWQRNGETGDAAPCGLEIAFGEALHLWRAGGMICDDEVDDSVAEGLPELFAIFAAADGRGALEERCFIEDLLFGEMEIVGAGFDRYRQSSLAGGAQFGKSARGRKMDDVEAKFEFATEREKETNRGEFGLLGTRLEIGLVERPIGIGKIFCGGIDGSWKFGVDEEREFGAGDMRESGAQLGLGDNGEAIDAGMDQKTFEAGDASAGERLEVERVVGDDAAPGEPIDAGAAMRGGALCFEGGDLGGGGKAIQRHVDEESVATGGSGARGGFEAFPIGAAGVVDVDVRIDQARKYGSVAKIVGLRVGRDLIGRDYVEDFVTIDEESGGAHTVWRHCTAGKEGAETHKR